MWYDAADGVAGIDNVVMTSNKKCRPTWSAVHGYKPKMASDYWKDLAINKDRIATRTLDAAGDIQPKSEFSEVDVESVEHCARLCILGSACDMFHVTKPPGQAKMKCTYNAHTSLKQFPTEKVLEPGGPYTGPIEDVVYILQCSAALDTEVAANTDWFTHHKGDWTEETDCPSSDNGERGIMDERVGTYVFHAQVTGQYQYSAYSKCDSPHKYWISKEITTSHLENFGLTQDYIAKLKPAAYVRTFGRVLPYGKVFVGSGDPTEKRNMQIKVTFQNGSSLSHGTNLDILPGTDTDTQLGRVQDTVLTKAFESLPLGDFTIKAGYHKKADDSTGRVLVLTPPEVRVDLPLAMGCYTMSDTDRGTADLSATDMTTIKCVLHCHGLSKRFSVLGGGSDCYCYDKDIIEKVVQADSTECNNRCSGDLTSLCGGANAFTMLVAECQDSWARFGESCFKGFTNNTLDAEDAYNMCGEQGGTVWLPESPEEAEWVAQVFK